MPPVQQGQRVTSGPGAQVEHPADAQVKGRALEGRQPVCLPEEPRGRQEIGIPQVVHDEDARIAVSPFEG
jgi:hypothetical protein